MFSVSSMTVKNLQRGLFFIDAAAMWSLKPLGMTGNIILYCPGGKQTLSGNGCCYLVISFSHNVMDRYQLLLPIT